ncbi:MAG: CHASE2 domain-containing protein [Gammaproteobacteria bacterium]|nr:CHASE2 domain-containing protein [Gammaproteobacteria bacterium]
MGKNPPHKEQRLHQQITGLQARWDLLNEKLPALEKQKILETRADEKFLLEQRIAEALAEREQVEQELHQLESHAEKDEPPKDNQAVQQGRWRNLGARSRHFAVNMAIGLSIALLVMGLHHHRLLQGAEERLTDWMIAIFQGQVPDAGKESTPFVFMDIDERSYRNWGEPLYTPRDNLLKLIKFAVQGQAEAVIVDINLSRQSGSEGLFSFQDQALFDYLKNYSGTCTPNSARDDARCPQIILVRMLRAPMEETDAYPQAMDSFLDAAVAASDDVHWASGRFPRGKYFFIRRSRLWEIICTKQGEGRMIPAIPLLTVALLKEPHKKPRQIQAGLQQALQRFVPADCVPAPPQEPAMLNLGKGRDSLEIGLHHLQQRIFYKIPWKLREEWDRPVISWHGKQKKLLEVFSADAVLQAMRKGQKPEPQRIEGSVLVIGGSFGDSRDIYYTPTGQMPGPLVIINAIHSLMQHGTVEPPAFWKKLLLEAVFIVIIGLFFTVLDTRRGMLVSGLFIFTLLPAGFLAFATGVWLGFAIPLAVTALHHAYAMPGKQSQENL